MKWSHIITKKFVAAALLSLLFGAFILPARANETLEDPAGAFAKCWDLSVSPDLSVAAESDRETVFLVDTDRKLAAVDMATGNRLWSSEIAGDPVSNVLVTNGLVIIASQSSPEKSVLRAVSKSSGITQWTADLLSKTSSVSLGSLNGTVVALAGNGKAMAFHTDRGAPAWIKEIGASATTSPFFLGRILIVGTDRKDVVGITIPDGTSTVLAKIEGSPTAVFSVDAANILIGDDRGNLILTSISGKRSWRFRNGARITAIAGYDSEYLATSHDNFLYKLTRGGNVEWKRRLSARIDGRPILVDRSVIVSTVGDGNVYAIDATNGKILNRIETGEETTAQVASGKLGFAIISTKGLSFYSVGSCAKSNKKTVPELAPSREKS